MSFLKNIFKKIGFVYDEDTKKDNDTKITAVIEENGVDNTKLIDEDYLDDLEEQLIKSDLGIALSLDFIDKLRHTMKTKELKISDMSSELKSFLLSAFQQNNSDENTFKLNFNKNGLSIFLIVGVNGVGKTTSIAKLAHRFKQEGKKVLIAAGDTFRAAAEDQLRIWAQRSGADFIELEHGSKSSAVVYNAIEKAKNEKHDVLIIDTAGRLQNKKNLMEELAKLKQVIDKNAEAGSLTETMLVLDSSTGQNAISQAENFNEICSLSSIILTKFDGTAKAGVVFSIAHKLQIPVKLLGTGESIEDLQDFNPDDFIKKYL